MGGREGGERWMRGREVERWAGGREIGCIGEGFLVGLRSMAGGVLGGWIDTGRFK